MNLGQYVATIEANISNFERNLDKADSVYSSFAKKNIQAEKQRLEAIKNIVEQETGIRVNNSKEIEEVTKAYSASQISNIKKLANAYVVHNNKITKEEQARASAILRESQRIEKQKQKEANTLKLAEEKRARQAEQASARVQRALQKEAEKAEELRKRILQWSTLAITVPIVFGTKKAMQDFIAFQSELYNVKAVTGATSSEMKQMTETALEMSQVFSKTGTEIATAFLQLGQAGYEASEILTSAKDVMLLSAAGMKDIDFTAELVVTTLKAFNLEADQSGRIVDVFASSAAKSVSSLDKISASLKYTAGLWGSQNWEIENLVGILDVLFDTGVRGEKAGRLLASAINGLQKPTAGASRTIEKLLGDVDALNPAMNDVTAIVKKLADANAKTADIFQIFGKEGTDVMLRLIQNVEKIDGAIAEVTGQSGEAANQATIQMQSLGSQWDILKNKVTAFSKQVIGFMEPMFQSLIKGAGNFFDALNKMPDWLKTIVTLGTTFALLGAPVAGLALKVKEFTAIMKIAGVTASATGLALKTAFPIMAAVGLAVGGIASAYAYSAKKHEEWVNSVNSGIEKLEKEGKTVEEMVKDIEKLYGTMEDTDKVTSSLRELGQVFPELRKYINQNANDTAGAMAKMYEELAKLNVERSKLAQTQIDTANTVKDINIATQEKAMSDATATYNHILSTLLKSQGATERITKSFNDAFGATKSNPIFNTFQDVLDKLTELTRESEDYKKIIDSLRDNAENEIIDVDELLRAVIAIRTAKTELNELKARGQTPVAVAPVLADNYSLQEAIGEVVEKLKKQFGTFDIQITAGTAEAESIIKSFGDIANSELLLIKEKYKKELMEVGAITPSGDWAEGFLAYMEEGAEKVALAFDGNLNDAMDKLLESSKSLLTGATVAGLDDAVKISEIQQAINANEVILAGLNEDKVEDAEQFIKLTKENDEYKKQEVELAKNVNTQTRDALRILFGFVSEAEKLGGSKSKSPVAKQLDWWEQIVQALKDANNEIKGIDVTSLLQKFKEFSLGSGDSLEEIKEQARVLGEALNDSESPLVGYISTLDLVSSAVENTSDIITGKLIKTLEDFGVDLEVEKELLKFGKLEDIISSSAEKMAGFSVLLANGLIDTKQYNLLIALQAKYVKEAENAMDDYLVSIGKMSEAEASARKNVRFFKKELVNDKGMAELREKIKNTTANYYEIEEVLKDIKDNTKDSFSENIEQMGTLFLSIQNTIDSIETLKESLKKAKEEGEGTTDIEFELKMNKEQLSSEIDMVMAMIKSGLDDVMATATKLRGVSRVWGEWARSLKNVEDGAERVRFSLEETQDTISIMLLTIGNAVFPSLGTMLAGLYDSIKDLPQTITDIIAGFAGLETASEKLALIDIKVKVTNSAQAAMEELQKTYYDYGESLIDSIISGVESGEEVDTSMMVKKMVFRMMSEQLVESSGLKERMQGAIDNLWKNMKLKDPINVDGEVFDNLGSIQEAFVKINAQAKVLKGEMDALGTEEGLLERIKEIQKAIGETPDWDLSTQDTLKEELAIATQQYEGYKTLQNAYKILQDNVIKYNNALSGVMQNTTNAVYTSSQIANSAFNQVGLSSENVSKYLEQYGLISTDIAKKTSSNTVTAGNIIIESYNKIAEATRNAAIQSVENGNLMIKSLYTISDVARQTAKDIGAATGSPITLTKEAKAISDRIDVVSAEIKRLKKEAKDVTEAISSLEQVKEKALLILRDPNDPKLQDVKNLISEQEKTLAKAQQAIQRYQEEIKQLAVSFEEANKIKPTVDSGGGITGSTWIDTFEGQVAKAAKITGSLGDSFDELGNKIWEFEKLNIDIDTEEIKQQADTIKTEIDSLLNTIFTPEEVVEMKTGDVRESISSMFAEAVVSGNYRDFKNGVYNMILGNITEALVNSSLMKGKIQKLVDQVMATDENFNMNDVQTILREVNSLWTETFDAGSPLGVLFSGLRDSLSQFGAFDISVNPGQVVTALPSEAMNKLDQAFQEVADRLSQAITESGLNSHIDLVNITTAYIERMTANSVVINNAVFDMSGDLVLNNISGSTVGEFLENLVIAQVEASRP